MPKLGLVAMDYETLDFEKRMAEEAGVEVVVSPRKEGSHTLAQCADCDGIVTSYGLFDRAVIEGLMRAKVIVRSGVGVDTIDIAAATEHGIAVCNVPGYATQVVSDHAITLAMGVLRRINELDADLRAGVWGLAKRRPLGQVKGRIFGVVGMGDIGRETARKARGLGFQVLCWSRSLEPGTVTSEGFPCVSYEELLQRSDVVSFHTALMPETHHLLDTGAIALMKPDAIVVNTSRGAVVDTAALAQALEEGKLWGAGIDVFEEEPLRSDDPLFKAPHTLLSPHAAYWSEESGSELRTRAMQHAIDAVLGRTPGDCLNPEVFG